MTKTDDKIKKPCHIAVRKAIADGTLVKKPCERCGAKRAHAHHDDYTKPLEVTWLCQRHHAARHAEIGFGESGRPVSTERGSRHAERAITLRLSAAEKAAIEASAGRPDAAGKYLRSAGLALIKIVDALASAGDTLTNTEANRLALGYARHVIPTPATSGEE